MNAILSETLRGPAGSLAIRRMDAKGKRRGTLLFIHGAWSSTWYWEPHFMPFFAASGFDVVALDLRGHGRSDGEIRWATIDGYVADAAAVAATLEDPVVVGHSMGGLVAQHLAARHPVAGLALLASVPPWGAWSALWRVVRQDPAKLLACTLAFDLKPIVADASLARSLLYSRSPAEKDMDPFLYHLGSESYLAFLGMLFRHPPRLPAGLPRFVLGAERDRLFPEKTVCATARRLGVEPRMVAGASHMLTVEHCWQDAADALLHWLEREVPAARAGSPAAHR